MSDMTNESSAGPSAWARDLYGHLTSHVQAERGLLERYAAVAEQTQSKAFRYLVNLLIEDERRHHRIFQEIAQSLRTDALLAREEPIVPRMDFDQADRATIVDVTNQLLEIERRDAGELKRLQHQIRDAKDTSLWGLLVDLMQRDTQRHIAILRFVRKHS